MVPVMLVEERSLRLRSAESDWRMEGWAYSNLSEDRTEELLNNASSGFVSTWFVITLSLESARCSPVCWRTYKFWIGSLATVDGSVEDMLAFRMSLSVDTLFSESNSPSERLVIPVAWNSRVVKDDRLVKDEGSEPADQSIRKHSPANKF